MFTAQDKQSRCRSIDAVAGMVLAGVFLLPFAPVEKAAGLSPVTCH